MSLTPPDPDALAAAFFGPGNGFSWNGPDQPRLRAWVEDLRDPARPIFLPRLLNDGRVRWYAVARTSRQARDLQEQLLAFLGPTYTDFNGLPVELDEADPVEAVLEGHFSAVFALTVVRKDDTQVAEALFNQLRSLLQRRPSRPEGDTATQGRLIRDFDLALRDENWEAAERLLADLRARGQMTPLALTWLKVRLLSARGMWQEILDLPDLPDLLARSRPAAVTEAIQAAVYHVYLAQFDVDGQTGNAVAHFRANLAMSFGPLFRIRIGDPTSPAGKAAAIAAAAFAPPEAAVPPVRPPEVAPAPEPTAEEKARRAVDANDYDTAYPLLRTCPPTATSLGMLLVCADERADSPATAGEVIATFDAAPPDVVQAVLSRKVNRRIMDDLRAHLTPAPTPETAPEVPTGWTDWLERLNRDGAWPKAADAARSGVREWSIAAIQDDPAEQGRFVHALAAGRTGPTAAVVRNSLPQLLEAFLPCGIPDSRLKPVYRQMLESVVLDDELSAASAGTILELATALLACGLTTSGARNDYAELMDLLMGGSEAFRSPTQFGRAAQLLDELAANGVHRHADINPLLQMVATEFRVTSSRVTDGQWAIFERACADFGQPEVFLSSRPKPQATVEEEDEDTRFRQRLNGLTVALLTMSDQIAATFLRAVERRFPDTRFKILKEKDDSKQLRDVARNADVFIVNTYDVPHQASGPVKKYRSDENTLYPAGKTATQQVEALYRWLRTGATSL